MFLNAIKRFFQFPNMKLIFFANFIEFADLYFFIHCAPMIAKIFVPEQYQHWMTTFSLWIAYGVPPIAAIIFARLGDDWGRRAMMILSTSMMLVLTIMLVILPSYQQIGVWSLVGFCTIRVVQALSIAGEGACAWVYAYESTRRFEDTAFTVPFISLGEMLSGVASLGTFLFLFKHFEYLGEETIIRIMFGCLALLFVLMLHNRKRMEETKTFIMERQRYAPDKVSFTTLYRDLRNKKRNWSCLVAIMMVYPLGFTISYVFMGEYLKTNLGFSETDVIYHNMFVAIAELVLVFWTAVIVGSMEDKGLIRRKYSYLCISFVSLFCSIVSYFYLSHATPTVLAIWFIQFLMVMPVSSSFIIGNFYRQFAVIGRFSGAASAWATARILGLIFGGFSIEYLHRSDMLEYFLVFTVFSVIQIAGILISRDHMEEKDVD